MTSIYNYIPIDRYHALAQRQELPDRTWGAALFADISGFTILTQDLATRYGSKEGAEILTKYLNEVYTALIDELHNYHGSVIGFSGDAITCWFDHNEGELAISCAMAMQQVMEKFTHITLDNSPPISLAIKIAIATGSVRRFVVGQPDIQLIDVLAGATLSRMNEAADVLERGEIVIPLDLVEKLKPELEVVTYRYNKDKSTQFAIIRGLKQPLPPRPWGEWPVLSDDIQRDWLLPRVYEQQTNPFWAEMRPTVALFMNFQGLDYDHDEAAPQKLAAYIQAVQASVTHHGGFLIQLTLGDKGSYVYAAFGALVAQIDNALQAIATALEWRTLAQQTTFIESVHVGISHGRAYTGLYGSPAHSTFGVLGPHVNLAARLMMKAESGQIWVTEGITHQTNLHYEFTNKKPYNFKNIEQSVYVATLKDKAVMSGHDLPMLLPCVGRESELAQLAHWAKLAHQGQGQLVLVEGEPGIGKSHLLATFGGQLQTQMWRVIRGGCHPLPSPYQIWQPILKELLGESFTLVEIAALLADRAEYAPLLGELLGQSWEIPAVYQNLTPEVQHGMVQASIIALLQAIAKQQPLALILEDVHWLDNLSRELLRSLAYQLAELPLLVLVSQRIVETKFKIGEEYAQLLHLTELAMANLSSFVSQVLVGTVDDLVVAIATRGGQSPFSIKQALVYLNEQKQLQFDDDGVWRLSPRFIEVLRQANCLNRDVETGAWQLNNETPLPMKELPPAIDELILTPFDRLPHDCRHMLNIVSVMGYEFVPGWLDKVNPHLRTWLSEAVAHEFLMQVDTNGVLVYQFKHHHLREAIYNKLMSSYQKELHQEVGTALERFMPSAVELLADQFKRGGVRAKWLNYGERVAIKAQQNYANETAKNYYGELLATEERPAWRLAYTEVLHAMGDKPEEEQVSLEKLAQHEADIGAGQVAFLWGKYYEQLDQKKSYAQAQVWFQQAQQHYQNDKIKLAECLERLGFVLWKQDKFDEAETCYYQATQRVKQKDNPLLHANIFNGLGTVYREKEKWGEAKKYYEQALAMSDEQLVKSRTLNNLGLLAWEQDKPDYEAAKQYYEESLFVRRKIGCYWGEAQCLANIANLYEDLGEYDQADEYFNQALKLQVWIKSKRQLFDLLNSMGIMYHNLGVLAKAESLLRQVLTLTEDLDGFGKFHALQNLGFILSDQQKFGEAQQKLEEGFFLACQKEDEDEQAYFHSYLGLVYLGHGQFEQAKAAAKQAFQLRQANSILDGVFDLATLAQVHLVLGEVESALRQIEKMEQILQDSENATPAEWPQRNYWIGYQVFKAAGQAKTAQSWLQKGYDLVQSRAAKISDRVLKQSYLENVAVNRAILQTYQANFLATSANKLAEGVS